MADVPQLPDLVSVGARITAGTLNNQYREALAWVMRDAPVVQALASTVQTLPGAAWTAINVPTVVFDSGGLTGGGLPSQIHIGRALGLYLVQGVVAFQAPTGGRKAVRLALNGAQVDGSIGGGTGQTPTVAVTPWAPVVSTDIADVVEVQALVVDGTDATNVSGWQGMSSLTAIYLRAF